MATNEGSSCAQNNAVLGLLLTLSALPVVSIRFVILPASLPQGLVHAHPVRISDSRSRPYHGRDRDRRSAPDHPPHGPDDDSHSARREENPEGTGFPRPEARGRLLLVTRK